MIRAAVLFLCLLYAAPATAQCRMALAIGLDVSSSVDAAEHEAQLAGLARALRDAEVQSLMLNGGDPISLSVYVWSGRSHQAVIIPWSVIDTAAQLDSIAARLPATSRGGMNGPTALGASMLFGAELLLNGPDCATHILDITGDGPQNAGPRPRDVRPSLPASFVINALVIAGAEHDTLVPYFQAEVIHGPGAFVEIARDYADFGRAMKRKLLRELTLAVSMLEGQ